MVQTHVSAYPRFLDPGQTLRHLRVWIWDHHIFPARRTETWRLCRNLKRPGFLQMLFNLNWVDQLFCLFVPTRHCSAVQQAAVLPKVFSIEHPSTTLACSLLPCKISKPRPLENPHLQTGRHCSAVCSWSPRNFLPSLNWIPSWVRAWLGRFYAVTASRNALIVAPIFICDDTPTSYLWQRSPNVDAFSCTELRISSNCGLDDFCCSIFFKTRRLVQCWDSSERQGNHRITSRLVRSCTVKRCQLQLTNVQPHRMKTAPYETSNSC